MKSQFNALFQAAIAEASSNGTKKLPSKREQEIRKQVASEYISKLAGMRADRLKKEAEALAAREEEQRLAKEVRLAREKEELAAQGGTSTIREIFGANFPPVPISIRARESETEVHIPDIDPDYVFRPAVLSGVMTWLNTRKFTKDSLWLAGPTGSGKTSIIDQVCARLNIPLYSFEGHERREPQEFFGGWVNGPNGMFWLDGPIVAAARVGGIALINEGDAIPPSALIALNGALEGYPIQIPETGEKVPISDGFGIVFACNTNGGGDINGFYGGTLKMNGAFCDRFQCIKVDYMEPTTELEVMQAKIPALPMEIAENMVKMANEVRASFLRGDLELTFSTRTLIRWGYLATYNHALKKAGGEPIALALNTALANRGEPETQQSLLEIGQRVFGGDHAVWMNGGKPLALA